MLVCKSLTDFTNTLLSFAYPVLVEYVQQLGVRQRTDQIDAFTTEMSCLTIVWAVMQDIHFHKVAVS